MSSDDLQQAQRSGTTLTELASQKGVSKDDLVASIAKDMPAMRPEGAPELDATRMTEMATNIADADRAKENLSALAARWAPTPTRCCPSSGPATT